VSVSTFHSMINTPLSAIFLCQNQPRAVPRNAADVCRSCRSHRVRASAAGVRCRHGGQGQGAKRNSAVSTATVSLIDLENLRRDFLGKIACFVWPLFHLSRVVPCFAPRTSTSHRVESRRSVMLSRAVTPTVSVRSLTAVRMRALMVSTRRN
jgi:hypothetical protein